MSNKTGWREKLQPVFFELAELNRQSEHELAQAQEECDRGLKRLGANAPEEFRAKIVHEFQNKALALSARITEKLVDIDQRYRPTSYNPLSYSYLGEPPTGQAPGDDRFPQYLHWLRHRESLQITVANDSQGDLNAFRKIARTGEDLRRIAHRKGRLKPFQGDIIHRQLLELILCFEINPLTAEERADCMDCYCACGKMHDPDALKKQAARLKKELQGSAEIVPNATSSDQRSKKA